MLIRIESALFICILRNNVNIDIFYSATQLVYTKNAIVL